MKDLDFINDWLVEPKEVENCKEFNHRLEVENLDFKINFKPYKFEKYSCHVCNYYYY